ncbi:MAG TPA: MBL fold metallo-hydrolase [Chloroflexota bacterium]|nr:MBL fold metallo-hydrolase [Chloroflexota bacterium]
MRVRLWGTRGSVAAPGVETARYGGNTSCVEVRHADGTLLILDAGTGIRRLGSSLDAGVRRVDVLLSHLHMDHIQGLGFFDPLHDPAIEVHLWGPCSPTQDLWTRLVRYLSPPLFPVYLRDLPWLHVHNVGVGRCFEIGPFTVSAELICHPGPTLGYRIADSGATLAYLPDHEPALGLKGSYLSGEWTSGFGLAHGADLLIHDGQYTDAEYADRVGWGHSSIRQAVGFARLAEVSRLVLFHHNPTHTDDDLDRLIDVAAAGSSVPFPVMGGMESATFDVISR